VIASYKYSSLFGLIISDEGKKLYNIDTRLNVVVSRKLASMWLGNDKLNVLTGSRRFDRKWRKNRMTRGRLKSRDVTES
jgi:hypothetical protein